MAQKTVAAFESQLKNKIQFKASSKVSVDAVLFKAFKFFDLYNNGCLPRTDFFKAIAKCGVVVDTHDIETVFSYYDSGNTGKIDYRIFIENLLFNNKSETNSEHMSKSQYSEAHMNVGQQRVQRQSRFDKKSEANSQLSPSDKLKSSNYQHFEHENLSSLEDIIEEIKINIRSDGICGLLNFANKLKSTDHERTHLISPSSLHSILRFLPENAIHTIISRYNPNKFHEINYAQLIYGLKGNMDLQRQSLIDDLFNMVDTEQKGQVQINHIISLYRNRSQIGAFKRAIDAYCKFQSIDDGIFTDQDFNDFFEFVSFSFNSDQSFQEFVRVGFYGEEPARSSLSRSSRRQFDPRNSNVQQQQQKNVDINSATGDFRKLKIEQIQKQQNSGSAYKVLEQNNDHKNRSQVSSHVSRRSQNKSHVSSNHVQQVNMMLLRIRRTLASKGSRGFLHFEKILRKSDSNDDGLITIDEFRNVIKEQKIDITNVQATTLFGIFDENKSGQIDYQDFLYTLKGEIPQNRQQIIIRIWEKVKIDDEHTNFVKLKSSLNFRSHPDVQTGRKYDDQLWQEIVDTILMIQDLNEVPRTDEIPKHTFLEYCDNLSLSISEDSLFQTLALNFWKIGTNIKIQDQYAGSRKLFDPSKKGYLQDHHRYAINGGSVSQNAPFGTFSQPTTYSTEHQKL